jgi:hypothetical protein
MDAAGSSRRHDYEVRDVDDDDVERPYYRSSLKSNAAVSPAPLCAATDPAKGVFNNQRTSRLDMPLGEQASGAGATFGLRLVRESLGGGAPGRAFAQS